MRSEHIEQADIPTHNVSEALSNIIDVATYQRKIERRNILISVISVAAIIMTIFLIDALDIMGFLMDRRISCLYINHFIKKNNIDMSEYYDKKYISFNDFFTRKIIPSKRPIIKDKNTFTSCADSYFTCYKR